MQKAKNRDRPCFLGKNKEKKGPNQWHDFLKVRRSRRPWEYQGGGQILKKNQVVERGCN